MVPMIPLITVTDPAAEQAAWKALVLVLAQSVLILDVVKGQLLSVGSLTVPAVVAILGSAVFLSITAWLFQSDRIVLGR